MYTGSVSGRLALPLLGMWGAPPPNLAPIGARIRVSPGSAVRDHTAWIRSRWPRRNQSPLCTVSGRSSIHPIVKTGLCVVRIIIVVAIRG